MNRSAFRPILLVTALVAVLGGAGCIRKAKPASPAGFIPPENLAHATDLPFNAAWRKKDLDWHHYTEIYIAPWNIEYLRKMTWWEKIERGEKIKEDAKELAAFARLTFQEAFRNDRKRRFQVVEEPGPNTLIAEFALSPLGRGRKRAGSSPPSPESDLAPIRFMAMLSVPCASGESAPSDMPGVTNRLRISVIDSTSSIEIRRAADSKASRSRIAMGGRFSIASEYFLKV